MIISYSEHNLKLIKAAILAGDVVSFPTDTLFALACDATNSKAIEKLFALKKRPIDRTAPVLVASSEQGSRYAKFNETAHKLADAFWPGALTMVLPALEGSDLSVLAVRNGTVGIRMPNSAIALNILKACGVPLLGTSANLSNSKELSDANEIVTTFGKDLALVVMPDKKPSGIASTIIKIDDEIQILRDGAITRGDILQQIQDSTVTASVLATRGSPGTKQD